MMHLSYNSWTVILSLVLVPSSSSFILEKQQQPCCGSSCSLHQQQQQQPVHRLLSLSSSRMFMSSGKGFGKSSSNNNKNNLGGGKKGKITVDQTYGQEAVKDMIDSEAAMSEFFISNEEWAPLFRTFAANPQVPAMSFLGDDYVTNGSSENNNSDTTNNNDIIDFHEGSKPWKKLSGIPSNDNDREVLASFLDSCHKSLVDIPVNEGVEEDDFDLHFLEEGRRMLAVSRFHVLSNIHGGNIESYDTLFSTCWSELLELRQRNEVNTGSLIVLPDYDLLDLKRFTDINLRRPLEWLGVPKSDFEIASMERGSPAIRLLHKLQDMPTEPYQPPLEE